MLFYNEEDYYAAQEERCTTIAEAEREWVWSVGAMRPDQAWILSDRDAWYPNPFYQGPRVRHPEEEPEWPEDDFIGPLQPFTWNDIPF